MTGGMPITLPPALEMAKKDCDDGGVCGAGGAGGAGGAWRTATVVAFCHVVGPCSVTKCSG